MDLQSLLNTMKVATSAAGIHAKGTDKMKSAVDAGKIIMTAKNINKINSIKGKARESIAQFPVLISENLDPKIAPILTNALEVNYTNLVMLIISNISSFQSGSAGSVIGEFHNESGNLTESTFLEGVDTVHQLYEANQMLLQPYEDSFNLKSLNESYYTGSVMEYLEEAKSTKSDSVKGFAARNNAKTNGTKDHAAGNNQTSTINNTGSANTGDRSTSVSARDRVATAKDGVSIVSDVLNGVEGIYKAVDSHKDAQGKEADRLLKKKEYDDTQAQSKYSAGRGTMLSTQKDLVKLNDLPPTILNQEVSFIEPGSLSTVTKTLSIGVKCVGHLLKGDEIQYYLTKASYKNSLFLKLIKWTTGEIKFWKDLVFALDDVKLSSKHSLKGNKNYLSKLEYVSKNAKSSVLMGTKAKQIPSAITTLIITKTDVENIKYKDGINILSDINYLKKISEAYFLLGLLIVDESLDIVYSYDVIEHSLTRQTLASYERQSKERVVNASDLLKLAR